MDGHSPEPLGSELPAGRAWGPPIPRAEIRRAQIPFEGSLWRLRTAAPSPGNKLAAPLTSSRPLPWKQASSTNNK